MSQRAGAIFAIVALAAGRASGSVSSLTATSPDPLSSALGDPIYGFLFALCVGAVLVGTVWRDRSGLTLAAVCSACLIALLYADGSAYSFDVLRSLDRRSNAMLLFAAAAMYGASRLNRVLLGRDTLPAVGWRVLAAVEWMLLGVAAASVLLDKSAAAVLIRALALAGYTAAATQVYAAWNGWRAGDRHALFLIAGWLWMLIAFTAHQFSWLAGTLFARHEVHIAIGGALMLVAAGYIDRAMGYRHSWQRQQRETQQTGSLLRVERARRGFGDEVTRLIGEIEPGEYEERILGRFLEHLSDMVPVASAAVAISHRGEMRLVVLGEEDIRTRFESILVTREQLLQSVCLSDRAAVIHSDDLGINPADDRASCLGIVPVQADRNEWAAVLLARSGDLEFGIDELELVGDFAEQAYQSLRSAQRFRRVRREAETDSLTGLFNRRAVLARAERAFRKARSLRLPLAVLFVDVDHFKRINDECGHEAGDDALRLVANVCGGSLREGDFIGRYGGEEFLAVLPGADALQAGRVAERLRVAVESASFAMNGKAQPLTVSVGVSQCSERYEKFSALLGAADRALYRAKREGRNRVVHHSLMLKGDPESRPA